MVRTIPHRELRNNSSEILRQVAAGETVEVTNHGDVVAVLVPPGASREARTTIRSARVRGGFAALIRQQLDHSVQPVLDDLRGDR